MWTIDGLGARVEAALAVSDAQQPSARVREVPDLRTIRWYSTIGLLDRPAAMRGRTALYTRRHLLQLLAIKRLQARGIPLAEVQAQLAGATDGMLAWLADVDADWTAPAPAASHAAPATAPARGSRARFWAAQAGHATAAAAEVRAEAGRQSAARGARGTMLSASAEPSAATRSPYRQAPAPGPAPAPAPGPASGQAQAPGQGPASGQAPASGQPTAPELALASGQAPAPGQPASHPDLVPAIRLGNGVTLTLAAAARPLEEDDLPALKQAAGPLLELLRERGLDEPTG